MKPSTTFWGYNPMQDDWIDFTQSRPLHEDIVPHVQWTSVLLSETLPEHDVNVCLERPSGALPPDTWTTAYETLCHMDNRLWNPMEKIFASRSEFCGSSTSHSVSRIHY